MPSTATGTDTGGLQNIIHIVDEPTTSNISDSCPQHIQVESTENMKKVEHSQHGQSVNCTMDGSSASTYMSEIESTTTTNIQNPISKAIESCINQDISNPVEILRFLQAEIITGRKLEKGVSDYTREDNADYPNFIIIGRNDILGTVFDELNSIKDEDIAKTLEVQFYEEVSI